MRKIVAFAVALTTCLSIISEGSANAGPLPVPSPTITNSCNGNPFDVVIYGGTPSGVAAAVTAAKRFQSTLLISADRTVGGAMSNGLSATDLWLNNTYSSFASGFFQNVYNYYLGSSSWRFEPKVAEQIFSSLLDRSGANVLLNSTIQTVSKSNDLVHEITVGSNTRICGHQFIDASYTGDLMKFAQVPTNLTYSDLYSYQEPPARNRFFRTLIDTQDPETINAMDSAFEANPYVQSVDNIPLFGDAVSQGMPSMTYRLCVTNDPDNSVSFTQSKNYDKFAPSWRFIMQAITSSGIEARDSKTSPNGTMVTSLWRMAKIPNNKYDLNSGPYSLMNVPIPKVYFDDISKRATIESDYRDYFSSFLYFIQHDTSVPQNEKDLLTGFGLCADEFTDNENWPYELYVRQGRRLVGMTTLTTDDIFNTRQKKTSIAVAGYELDNKPSFFMYSNGKLVRDAAVLYRSPSYEIPYTAMLSKQGPRNLISSVMISTSPTAFGSVRIELTFMALGEAAGLAASIANETGRTMARVPYTYVQLALEKQKTTYRITKLCKRMNSQSRTKSGFDPKTCWPNPFPLQGL